MPKLKTRKSASKRFKKKNKKIVYRRSGKNHLRSKKSSARKRRLKRAGEVLGKVKSLFRKMSF